MVCFCWLFFSFYAVLFSLSRAKTFKPCELAKVLLDNEVDKDDISTWLCIARYESNFNSSAVGHMSGDGSLDHGIFQVNDRFWCTDADDDIMACGVTCKALEDDELSDDIACARRIFRQHKRYGNGWLAWAVFPHYCTSKETNDERFLRNNNCSLNSLSGLVSTKLQVIPSSPTVNAAHSSPNPQANIFNSNVNPVSTTASSMIHLSANPQANIFNSNVNPSSTTLSSNADISNRPSSTIPPVIFNANRVSFSALPPVNSKPQISSALNSKYSFTTFPPSLNFPQSSSTYSQGLNHHSNIFFSSTPVITSSSTRFPTTPSSPGNWFDFLPWSTTVRPASSTASVLRRFPFSG